MHTGPAERETILGQLRHFKIRHGHEYGLTSLGLFGSFARGDAREDSDVDVVFETSQPNLLRTSSMKIALEDLLGRKVDVIRFREDLRPHLKNRIKRDAIYV